MILTFDGEEKVKNDEKTLLDKKTANHYTFLPGIDAAHRAHPPTNYLKITYTLCRTAKAKVFTGEPVDVFARCVGSKIAFRLCSVLVRFYSQNI